MELLYAIYNEDTDLLKTFRRLLVLCIKIKFTMRLQ